jgi:hypothetical protein
MEVKSRDVDVRSSVPRYPKPDVDQRPGSSDVTWAESAYDHQESERSDESHRLPRASRPRLRILIATLAIVILMAGLVVAMRSQSPSPSPVVTQPTSSQTAAAHQATAVSPLRLSPAPVISPLLSPAPVINTPKR